MRDLEFADGVVIVGAGCIVVGTWQLHGAAGLIAAGALLVVLAARARRA